MKKSVYSLVLSDDVVALADRAAAKRGISRSSFIDELLAKELSYMTPQMRIREIFGQMEALMDATSMRLKSPPSDVQMSLLSSLSYKYNPTMRYAVELTHKTEGLIGALKISCRTQNAGFLSALSEFFYLMAGLERAAAPDGAVFRDSGTGKITRYLAVPEGKMYSPSETASAISAYIRMFDKALGAYVSGLPDTELSARNAAGVYAEYIRKTQYRI